MGRFYSIVTGLAAVVIAVSQAHAMVQIQMEGVDIEYLGSTVNIGSKPVPDPLINVSFLLDGAPLGTDSTDVSLQLFIPGVSGLVSNTPNSVGTGPGGTMYLDLGDGQHLNLTLGAGTVTFVPGGLVDFVFIAMPAVLGSQNLPYGLSLVDPIDVSFSTQIPDGKLTVGNSNQINGFTAAGTGEVAALPEPATIALLAIGGLLMAKPRRC